MIHSRIGLAAIFAISLGAGTAEAGSIFLTGHDPDFHAIRGSNSTGAININKAAIDYILDPLYNDVYAGGVHKFLFVESSISPPPGHVAGVNGIIASGYAAGVDFEQHDASTLDAELSLLGTKYAGIVVASDFGGILTQAELDILNFRSSDIIDFLNNDNGGLYAMSEGDGGAGLTPDGGHYGFLPFVVSSVPANQTETGYSVTAFGADLGLADTDVNGNYSHSIFTGLGGLKVVDVDAQGRALSIAGRGAVDPRNGISPVPLPAGLPMLLAGLGLLGLVRRRR